MSEKIIYGGFRYKRQLKEDRENKILRCEVSERWIQLPNETAIYEGDSVDYMHLNVMTNGNDGKPRKLCNIVVNRAMLTDLLGDIPTRDCRKKN